METASSIASAREARRCALALIARRDRSAGEIRERLARRGFTPDAVVETIEWLVSRRLIDENAMAARLVERGKGDRGMGRRGVRAWLGRFGIAGDVAENALRGYRLDEELEVARALVEKRRREDPDLRGEMRLRRFLLRRGFHPETVASVMRKAEGPREWGRGGNGNPD